MTAINAIENGCECVSFDTVVTLMYKHILN